MITEKKVRIYDKYNGFEEGYIFKNGDLPNSDFDLMDWTTINELIGNIILLKNNNVSGELRNKLKSYINQEAENDLVISYLEKLAEK
jgi:hypothetical protein